MDDLRHPAIQSRLKAIWTDPHSLDPAKKSAEVTRDIAVSSRAALPRWPAVEAQWLVTTPFRSFTVPI